MRCLNKKLFLGLFFCLTPCIVSAGPSNPDPTLRPTEPRLLRQIPYLGMGKSFNVIATPQPTLPESSLLSQYYTLQKSNPKQAKEVLAKLVKEQPTNVAAQLEMGYLLIKEKKTKDAIPYFETAQKLDPSNDQAKRQLKYLLDEENQSKTSKNAFQGIEDKNVRYTFSPLDQYYALQKSNPKQAKEVLAKLVKDQPTNVTAQLEMGYLLIKEKKNKDAIPYFQTAQKLDPSNKNTRLQLVYLLQETQGNNKENPLSSKDKPPLTLMDQFYAMQKKNPWQAEVILRTILQKNPEDVNANLQMGYFLNNQKRKKEALCYFQVVERLNPSNYEVKLEIAYLLNADGKNRDAYYKFQEVAKAPDCKLHLKGEEGMLGLAGQQTKLFKKPFFVDYYSAPYYLSRFKDYIFPVQLRAGVTYGKNNQGQVYSIIRYNRDTQSNVSNAIPAIFADNAVDYAIGTAYQPFQKIPIAGYIELGRAYELVTNGYGRRWKPDFRVGVTGYTRYGAAPVYSECLAFPGKFVGDVYGDFSYYSRYVHDAIGQLRVRPGIRALTYHNSSLDFYMNINTLFDTQRLFYNNILEVGPGIAFTPDNRFNFIVRVQATLGYYLPIKTSQPNPYASIYRTTIVELETYIRF